MCGIAGAFGQHDGKELVAAMTERLAHRGPDAGALAEHVTPTSSVVLGHRRLAIIDPTAAADQPLRRGGLTLVYNGELYNFRELRAELEGHGVVFATSSDTEVVLEAWRWWGPAALTRFRGMFALAIHDQDSGTLSLARDPLGIKPLYVMARGEGLLFSSELKALLGVVGDELRVNEAGMVAAALFRWLPAQDSAIAGVRQLRPGTWETHHPDGRRESGTSWDPVAVAEAARHTTGPDLRAVLEEAVHAHLISDVPVATLLSGGLDSSIVTALAHRDEPQMAAWTIAFREQDKRMEAMPDDARYARRLADRLGIRLHEIELRPDVADLLPRMVATLDEPIGDPAAINTFLMCRAAREAGIKVLLSGTGADELFGGYRKHLACLLAARYQRVPAPVRGATRGVVGALPVAVGGHGLRTVRWARRFLDFADLGEEQAFRRSYSLYDTDELAGLLAPELTGHVEGAVRDHLETYADAPADLDRVNRMCLADARMFLPGLNLAYTDRASMAASVEVRVPFADVDVFAAAFGLAGTQKIRGREQKAALKDAARAWLPDEIIDRPKSSFGAPIRSWLVEDLRELVDDTLLRGELVTGGFLRREPLQRLIDDQRAGRRDLALQVWQLLTLELWLREVRSQGVAA
ncbi:asparagine synthase (glutamine-hydrolyzing) [Nocardioides sp. BP30]|uniref:asparagine synthase (glutamine-hydrolyzing) n=1 Tax=Nocardioides sp. BP30 TaxID=3036374 RepID=UPI002469B90E|nr:asparagine synthase (glutamine-hydrolyzing) [Nocardioides sp. BP30]WGL53316.1 asparagine synthase (glutamine-hydrolyzing) [Nocardioides sp. BP30]